jgi:hypothetical protein
MKKWIIDKLLPALIMGLIVAAINTYIDVQMMKREFASMRAELTDLWTQANDQIQKR